MIGRQQHEQRFLRHCPERQVLFRVVLAQKCQIDLTVAHRPGQLGRGSAVDCQIRIPKFIPQGLEDPRQPFKLVAGQEADGEWCPGRTRRSLR